MYRGAGIAAGMKVAGSPAFLCGCVRDLLWDDMGVKTGAGDKEGGVRNTVV